MQKTPLDYFVIILLIVICRQSLNDEKTLHGTLSIFSRLRKNAFIITVSVMILYVILLLYSDITKLSKHILEIDYRFLPAILFLANIMILLLALRFHRLLRKLGIEISLKKSILIYISGLSFGITPGGAGTIVKSHIIKSWYNIPISKTAPIIFVEKWTELNSVLLILTACIFIEGIMEVKIIGTVGIIVSLLFLGLVRNQTVFSIFKKTMIRFKLSKYEEIIENSQSTFKILTGVGITLEGLFITTIAKLAEAFSIYLVLKALKMQIDFIFSTQVFYTSIVSGFLSFIPGGFIVTEGSMLGLLVKYGTEFSLATVAVIFSRLLSIWYATILGLITTKFIIKYQPNTNQIN